ncbi:GntR family transcriptional regulator [Microbaculum sp. FT89]|uniref:GntR family transcriptional regulator n=1 Tax=Microbaculum sp. FT89 TaxID=3447298 RepID=UPI003F53BABE
MKTETKELKDLLVRSGAAPLYVQVADLLRDRLEKGEWKDGDYLPSLERLMDEFAVSRVTMRYAIKKLSADGLLSAERGRGTVVTALGKQRPLRVEGSLADLIQTYRGDRPEVYNLEEGFALPPVSGEECLLADRYFHIRRVHLRDEVRYCIISIYIEQHVFEREEQKFRDGLALPVLAEMDGLVIATARQSVTLGKCGAVEADLLDYPRGDPVANVRRILTGEDGLAIYVADVIYRGDCIRFDMDLKP